MKTFSNSFPFIIFILSSSQMLDNYIVLYFNQGCKYSSGFANSFRYDIDFIINKKNNITYKKEQPFNVEKDYGIEIHFNKAIIRLDNFFYSFYDENMKYLVFVDLSKFDSSKINDMKNTFRGCSSLESINLSNFDTSKVTNMGSMLHGCNSLESIDLSCFDTSQVTVMRYMFYECSSLKFIDLSSFDSSQITDMGSMFEGCSSLVSINLSNFNTSNVNYMGIYLMDVIHWNQLIYQILILLKLQIWGKCLEYVVK